MYNLIEKSLNGIRQWYAVFPLMCGGLSLVKTPPTKCPIGKTPGSIRHLFTITTGYKTPVYNHNITIVILSVSILKKN